MATEEKRMIHGVQVVFPCKPYPSQFSMMEKVIKGIERKQNCLLESPTGSGKSLALLCSALAWQTAEYEKKKSAEANPTTSESPNLTCTCQTPKELNHENNDVPPTQEVVQTAAQLISLGEKDDDDNDDDFKDFIKFKTPGGTKMMKAKRGHQSIAYETSPPGPEKESNADSSKMCCACSCKQEEAHTKANYRVPKIYFGTRTHKQITQIVRELRKTAYREAKMTILGSREHTCIHPSVSTMKGKNEGCKELLDGPGCKFNDRVKKVFACQSQIKDLGLTEAWDLEDIIHVGRAKTACPYYGTRSLKKNADIIFSPYNYLIDPIIREAMEINLKDQIIILDEAHNMEDAAREAASQTLKSDDLEKAVKELDEMIANGMKTPDCLRIRQMCQGLIKFMEDNEASLQQQSYDQAYRCWSGYDIIARMDQLGIGPKHFEHINKAYGKVKETDQDEMKVYNSHGQEVKLSKPVLITLEAIHKVLDYLYRDDLKFVPDYRVAIVKTTSYGSNNDTDNSWLNSKKRRGKRPTPITVNSINFWCMNPGVAFSDFNDARNIVLTSGTLSPMASFESELGAPFPIKLEANHVIEDKQVWVGAIGHGPNGGSLQAVYKTMETFNFQDELGELVLKVCQKVPHGVLVFLPSYKSLEKFSERWKNTGVWAKIERKKKIMTEPRASDKIDFECLMKDFYNTIDGYHDENEEDIDGALFIAVCRGKVSEGMDFADNNARAVITVGIPFPNIKDVQVKLKREFNDMHKNSRGLLSGGEWYEIQAFRALNQALGRCLRHRKDWGALILADERFVRDGPRYCKGLSKWMRNKVRPFQGFFTAMDSLSTFTENCIKDMPKIDPNASFIPGTPVTPGHRTDLNQSDLSPITSTPLMKEKQGFDTKKQFSIFTPIKPGKDTAHQSNQSLQSTNQKEHKLASPTEVKGDATLRKTVQSQQVHKAPSMSQSSSNPTQLSVSTPMANVNTSTGIASTAAQNTSTRSVSSLDEGSIGKTLDKSKSERHRNSSLDQSIEKPLDQSKNESGSNEESGINKFFKFCKLPEKSCERVNKSGDGSDLSTSERPTTPNMFDADSSEDEKDISIQVDQKDIPCNPDKDSVEVEVPQNSDVNIKSKTPVVRKPIFRKKGNTESVTLKESLDGESSDCDDFKVKRRSVPGNSKTDCPVGKTKVESEDEPLKTRRRGTKRKNHRQANSLTNKRSKGVDFLDNMDSSKENEPCLDPSLLCTSCGTVLIPSLKDFEKRQRTPSFLNGISRNKNTEYIYTVATKLDQLLPVEVNVDGISVNSTWSGETGCCVQYLRCQGCSKRTNKRNNDKDIIGAHIVCTSPNNNLFSTGQTWLLANVVKVKDG